MTARRLWLALVLTAVLGGFALRAVVAQRHRDRLRADALVYHRLAIQLLDEGYLGYGPDHSRSWRPPLYPAFLASVFAVGGRNLLVPRLVQAVLAAITILLVALLGRRLGRPWAGALGALIFAAYGHAIRQSVEIYPECLLALLITLYVRLGLDRPTPVRTVLRGLLAVAVLHLQPGLGTLVLLEGVWRLRRRERLAALLLVGVTVLGAVPWTIRNYGIHGRLVLISTNGGFNMLKGNHELSRGGPPTKEESDHVRALVRSMPEGLTEIERDRWYRQQALEWMKANPGRAIRVALSRFSHWAIPRSLIEPVHRWPVTYGTVFPFFLLGIAALWRRDRSALTLIGLVWLTATLPATLFVYVSQRYREPVIPLLAFLAGAGIVLLVTGIRGRLHAPRG